MIGIYQGLRIFTQSLQQTVKQKKAQEQLNVPAPLKILYQEKIISQLLLLHF